MAEMAAAPRGATPSAAAATSTTSRFAAACGALSQYVRASEVMARATAPAAPVRRPLPLMPGAEVPGCNEEPEATGPGPAPAAAAQLTIVYGGRVLVLDDVPVDKAAELLRLAAAAVAQASGSTEQSGAACGGGGLISAADLPVARKASLQRFMQKRKGRRDEPYRRPAPGGGRDDLTLAL